MIENCRDRGRHRPAVNADLENGYAHEPAPPGIIRLAAAAGIWGGSIEDATGEAEKPIYEFDHAVERVQARSRWRAPCR